MPRKIMEEFQLFEISAVDRPAQEGAKMVIMKRDSQKGEVDMDTKEQIAALEKQVGELTAQLTAAKADPKATDALQKTIDELKAQATESAEKLAAAEDLAKTEAAVAKMTDKEKAYLEREKDKDKQKKFLEATPEARKALIEKAESGDESITVNGTEVKKSVVGDTQFAIIKSQQEQIDKTNKALGEEKDRRETAEYTKRAETELGELPGEAAVKAKVLKAVDGMEKDAKEAVQTMLTAGAKAMKAAFTSLGHSGGPVDKSVQAAASSFEKHISEIAARDKVGKDVAMQKAREEYPDEFKAYQGIEAGN